MVNTVASQQEGLGPVFVELHVLPVFTWVPSGYSFVLLVPFFCSMTAGIQQGLIGRRWMD